MRYKFGWLVLAFFPMVLSAQGLETEGQKALQKVLEVLTLEEPQLPDSAEVKTHLMNGAWESLSYLNEGGGDYQTDDLLEAVPDYYHFREGKVIIKLIDPNDYNQYGMEATVNYSLRNDEILLIKPGGEIKDRWQLLYLDGHYMALDMGDLRVFFTHTPAQE